jgi:hypothetical protein
MLVAYTARCAREAGIRSGFLPPMFTDDMYRLHQVVQGHSYASGEALPRQIAVAASRPLDPVDVVQPRRRVVLKAPPQLHRRSETVDSTAPQTAQQKRNIRSRSILLNTAQHDIFTCPFVVTFGLRGARYIVPFEPTRAAQATLKNFEKQLMSVIPAVHQAVFRKRLDYAYKLEVKRLSHTATSIIGGDDRMEREVAFTTFLNAVFHHATVQLVWP